MIYLGNTPVGVGIKGVGQFTKHEQIKVTPSSSAELSVSHNLGVLPKVVMFSGNPTYDETQYVISGICDQKTGGYSTFGNDGIVVNQQGIAVILNETGSTNSRAYITTNQFIVRRVTAARVFDTNTEYTIDLYA